MINDGQNAEHKNLPNRYRVKQGRGVNALTLLAFTTKIVSVGHLDML